jgi:hypothetical protein
MQRFKINGNGIVNKTLNFNGRKKIKQAPFKSYVVLQDFTLDKSYTRAKRRLNDSKLAQSLIKQKYIK